MTRKAPPSNVFTLLYKGGTHLNLTYTHRLIRACYVIGIVIVITVALAYIAKITYPFLIAFGLAYLINPLVNLLQRKAKLPRSLAVIVTLFSIFSAFAGLITLLITEIVAGANYLSTHLPIQLNTLIQIGENFFAFTIMPFIERISILFSSLDNEQQTTILENVQNIGTALTTSLGSFIQDFFQKIPSFIGWFPNAATVIMFSILATFFISNDWNRIRLFFSKIIPPKVKASIGNVLLDLKKAFFGFLKAQFTLVMFTTLLVLIGLLVLRVEYAITIALMTGLLDLLPYLGSGAVFVPWIIYEVASGDLSQAIALSILYIIVIVQRQLMEPKVLSSSIGIDPLATLISLFVGYKLIGFLGLIIGPIILVILTALHNSNVFRDIWIFIKGKET